MPAAPDIIHAEINVIGVFVTNFNFVAIRDPVQEAWVVERHIHVTPSDAITALCPRKNSCCVPDAWTVHIDFVAPDQSDPIDK